MPRHSYKYNTKHLTPLNLSVPIEVVESLHKLIPEGQSISEAVTRILARELGISGLVITTKPTKKKKSA